MSKYAAIGYIEKNITRRDYLQQLILTAEADDSVSGETILQLKEFQSIIDRTVQQMPPKMREVYLLSREHQLSHGEIAQQLGIAPKTVKKHIQLSLQLMRKAIVDSPISLTVVLMALFSLKK